MSADEQDPTYPQTNRPTEPNHISGKPYAKPTPKESPKKSDDTTGFAGNDEKPERPNSWNEVPKERTRPEAPEISPE